MRTDTWARRHVGNLSTNVALLTANGMLPTNVLPANFASPGGIVWQSPSTTTAQAQPNVFYVLTNSQQVTITLPVSPNVGDIVELAGAGAGGWILAQNAGQMVRASFTPLVLSNDLIADWGSIAASSDGMKLAAGTWESGIWTSSNSGTNWVQTSAPTNVQWGSLVSSSDGTRLAAGTWQGGIWTFLNGVPCTSTASDSGVTMPGTAGFLEGNLGAVVELVYAGGGQFFPIYQTGSFSGH